MLVYRHGANTRGELTDQRGDTVKPQKRDHRNEEPEKSARPVEGRQYNSHKPQRRSHIQGNQRPARFRIKKGGRRRRVQRADTKSGHYLSLSLPSTSSTAQAAAPLCIQHIASTPTTCPLHLQRNEAQAKLRESMMQRSKMRSTRLQGTSGEDGKRKRSGVLTPLHGRQLLLASKIAAQIERNKVIFTSAGHALVCKPLKEEGSVNVMYNIHLRDFSPQHYHLIYVRCALLYAAVSPADERGDGVLRCPSKCTRHATESRYYWLESPSC